MASLPAIKEVTPKSRIGQTARVDSGGEWQGDYEQRQQETYGDIGTDLRHAKLRKGGMISKGEIPQRKIFDTEGFQREFELGATKQAGDQQLNAQQRYSGEAPIHLQQGAGALANQATVDTLSQQGPSQLLKTQQDAGDSALRRSAQNQRAQTGQQTIASGQLGQGAANTAQQRTSANIGGQIAANEATKAGQTMAEQQQAIQNAQGQAIAGGQLAEQQHGRDTSNVLQKYGIDTGAALSENKLGFADYSTQLDQQRQQRDLIGAQAQMGDANAQDILYTGALEGLTGEGKTEWDVNQAQIQNLEQQLSPEQMVKNRALELEMYSMSPEAQARQADIAQGTTNNMLYQTLPGFTENQSSAGASGPMGTTTPNAMYKTPTQYNYAEQSPATGNVMNLLYPNNNQAQQY